MEGSPPEGRRVHACNNHPRPPLYTDHRQHCIDPSLGTLPSELCLGQVRAVRFRDSSRDPLPSAARPRPPWLIKQTMNWKIPLRTTIKKKKKETSEL